MLPQSNIVPASPVKALINIGACLDVPTGVWVKGINGESIMLGGFGPITGITGIGNSYKSTIMHYMTLCAASRMLSTSYTHIETYDTEMNISEDRLRHLASPFPEFTGKDLTNDGTWNITDTTVYYGNKWFEEWKGYNKTKMDLGDKLLVSTPFLDRNKQQLKIILPTFVQVDSFSRFETEDVAKMQQENELGDSGGNMMHMRQGLSKMRFLSEAPIICGKTSSWMILSAHLGKENAIATGPYAPQPQKKLNTMRQGDKIKGVTDQFFFLTNNFWSTTAVSKLAHKDTKDPYFPKDKYDHTVEGECDLNLVDMTLLRGKFGASGIVIPLAVSQQDGVLSSLTEYLWIKEANKFGIEGNDQNYSLTLMPNVKLSRTTIRSKMDADPKLRRAMNITAEICQTRQFHRQFNPEFLDMKKIFDGVRERGYDWDFILEKTRGWWTVNNDTHPLYFLSSKDLVDMSIGAYHPYWLEDDKKTIKKQYLKAA